MATMTYNINSPPHYDMNNKNIPSNLPVTNRKMTAMCAFIMFSLHFLAEAFKKNDMRILIHWPTGLLFKNNNNIDTVVTMLIQRVPLQSSPPHVK